MKNMLFLLSAFLLISCQDFGQLTVVANLPPVLEEVSGIETVKGSDLIWMLNDSGNASTLYGVTEKGIIQKTLEINADNNDWEDLTTDSEGNLYIADFGNNRNTRKNLVILKVNNKDLASTEKVAVERIEFSYPEQKTFPPKKKQFFFDAESVFWMNDHLYIFTKSRTKSNFGKTSLYKVPATKGVYEAEFISEFTTCGDLECWITSADISPKKDKVVLLNHHGIWVFTDFKNDDFFSGTSEQLLFNHTSQKESVCFKNETTLYVADEKDQTSGRNFYTFDLTKSTPKK